MGKEKKERSDAASHIHQQVIRTTSCVSQHMNDLLVDLAAIASVQGQLRLRHWAEGKFLFSVYFYLFGP